jgi:beta-galactosidase
MFYGAAYYPEQRDPSRWEHDLDQMAEAHVNALRVGEFAWCFFEPREGDYDFAWMDRFRDLAWKRGIGLLMCPPLRTLPAWFAARDPSLRIVRDDGVPLEYGSRYSFCINHPDLRERGAALAAALVKHYGRDEAVVGWHLDNEHGDEPDCHCPICRTMFQIWVERKYGTIHALNEAWGLAFWGLQFDLFSQVPTPRVTKTYHSPGHTLDWRRFRSECTVEAAQVQADEVRPRMRKGQFITTNHQAIWNGRTDYYRMAEILDRAGTNYYPAYGATGVLGIGEGLALAQCRSYQNGAPFQIHELRCGPHVVPGRAANDPAPGEVARLAMHGVANGAEGLFYFRWRACPFGAEQAHGTITDYDGYPTRVFPEVKRVGAWLAKHGAMVDATRVKARAAVLVDFQTRWTFEALGPEWGAPRSFCPDQTTKVYGAMRQAGIPVDATSRWSDWSAYAILMVPALASCDHEVANKLAAYVRAGGVLIAQPLVGWKDERAHVHVGRLHPALRELLGGALADFATLDTQATTTFEWRGETYAGGLFAELPAVPEDTVEGRFRDGWYAGRPAVIRRSVGNGAVWWVCSFAEKAFFAALTRKLCRESGIEPLLPGVVPADVEVVSRQAADGRPLVFVLSASDQPRTLQAPFPAQDLYNDVAVNGTFTLAPYGVAVLTPRITAASVVARSCEASS